MSADEVTERRIRGRIGEAKELRVLSDAKLAEAASHRWRLFRNARLLREARKLGRAVDGIIEENALDLEALRRRSTR